MDGKEQGKIYNAINALEGAFKDALGVLGNRVTAVETENRIRHGQNKDELKTINCKASLNGETLSHIRSELATLIIQHNNLDDVITARVHKKVLQVVSCVVIIITAVASAAFFMARSNGG